MRIKDDFVVKRICDTVVVVPINKRLVEGYEPIVLNEDGGLIVESVWNGKDFEETLGIIADKYPQDDITELKEVLNYFIDGAKEQGYME